MRSNSHPGYLAQQSTWSDGLLSNLWPREAGPHWPSSFAIQFRPQHFQMSQESSSPSQLLLFESLYRHIGKLAAACMTTPSSAELVYSIAEKVHNEYQTSRHTLRDGERSHPAQSNYRQACSRGAGHFLDVQLACAQLNHHQASQKSVQPVFLLETLLTDQMKVFDYYY